VESLKDPNARKKSVKSKGKLYDLSTTLDNTGSPIKNGNNPLQNSAHHRSVIN
jgi:hypothetical protein